MTTKDRINPLSAFTQVGHALFSRDGVQLAFGERWDGKIIHISEADRGLSCGCCCPAKDCRRKLIAKKPDSNIKHHFSHAPLTKEQRAEGMSPSCASGPMTALHAYAERLLNEKKHLVLPRITATYEGRTRTRRQAKDFTFDAAMLETMDGETIPDVTLFKDGHKMHVEVFVTHRCGPEKRAKLMAADIASVEIDLSGLPRDITFTGLDEAILKTAPREWIHNRKIEELFGELKAEALAEAERAERERLASVARLKKAYGDAQRRAFAARWQDSDDVATVTAIGDATLLDGPSVGEGYFNVHPKVWKASILNQLNDVFGGCNSGSIIRAFAARGWLVEQFTGLDFDDGTVELEAKLPAAGAEGAVRNYLQQLAHAGIAQDHGWKWTFSDWHSHERDRRKAEQQRLVREASERASRHEQLVSLAREILTAGAIPDTDFDFAGWISHASVHDRGIKNIADEGGSDWRALAKGLAATAKILRDESEEVALDYGLPVAERLVSMRAVHEARAEQRKRDAEETARKEREARIAALVLEAKDSLGDDSGPWLEQVDPWLRGLTPRQAAAESPELLADAKSLLKRHLEECDRKARSLNALRRDALLLFKRADKVELYLKAPDPHLPGLVSPQIFVKDESSRQKCFEILQQRFGKRRKF